MNPYFSFFLFFIAITGFVIVSLVLNALLGPKSKNSAVKSEPFECGAIPVQKTNNKPVALRYFALAILFILFDIEAIFIYIWVIAAQPLNHFAFIAFWILLIFFIWMLGYIWREKILELED